jgi:hypothetical protein
MRRIRTRYPQPKLSAPRLARPLISLFGACEAGTGMMRGELSGEQDRI